MLPKRPFEQGSSRYEIMRGSPLRNRFAKDEAMATGKGNNRSNHFRATFQHDCRAVLDFSIVIYHQILKAVLLPPIFMKKAQSRI